MCTRIALGPREAAALARAHARCREFGMPPPARIDVGRLTRLVTAGRLTCADGTLDLCLFDGPGLCHGGMVRREVERGVPARFEIVMNGDCDRVGTKAPIRVIPFWRRS